MKSAFPAPFFLRRPQPAAEAGAVEVMVTTAQEIPGHRVARLIGPVRGISVRARAAPGFGGFQALLGGRLGVLTRLAETARDEALARMRRAAAEAGANAVIGMRFGSSQMMEGVSEILAYGAAVWAEPLAGAEQEPEPERRCIGPPDAA